MTSRQQDTPSRSDRSTRRRRHRKDRPVEVKEDTKEAVKPDLGQLRQLREAYFSGSSRRVPVKKATSRVASARSVATREANKRSTKRQSATKSRREHKSSTNAKPRDRTEEYVYRHSVPESRQQRRRSKRPPTHSTLSSRSSRSSSPDLLEEEVTPDDSISQIVTRSSRRHRALKRGTLRSIPEQSAVRTATLGSATTDKKGSGFWDSIFTRRSVSSTPASKVAECLTCGTENVPLARAAKLDCGHYMCHSCLRRIFKLSVQDPAHMPPKCCTSDPIPLKHVNSLFDLRFKLLFNKKLDEYNTKNRIYCPNRRCGIWLRPSLFVTSGGRKHARCNKCGTKACIHCGQKLHHSRECPKDPEIAKLVEHAEQQGWKRCFNCNAMVELKEGCNHMTCRCLAEFCMVCGAKWKTCDCPWFNHRDMPAADRLDDMMLPHGIEDVLQRVRVIYRDYMAEPHAAAVPQEGEAGRRPRPRGFRAELDHRRRQEDEDAALARRLQFATLD